MSPMQQMFLGLGKAPERTYIDDAFLTHLYGYSSSATITTNIDLTENGGMLWIKNRTNDKNHCLADTVTGSNKLLLPNGSNAQEDGPTGRITNITSTGFTLGSDDEVKSASHGYTSWNFARTPGFFDIVTYTGNGSGRNISHSLGCVPGMILVKCLSHSAQWAVYHRGTSSMPEGDGMAWNSDDPMSDFTGTDDWWDGNNRQPTATTFGVGTNTRTNQNTRTYVAYLFAGGESTAATARSVDFDGSGDYLEIDTSSDFAFGTGDYTIEFWMYKDATGQGNIYEGRDGGNTNRILFYVNSNNKLSTYINASQNNSSTTINPGQWYHCALSRQGSTNRMFLNGTLENSWSDSVDVAAPSGHLWIGQDDPGSNDFNGKISNLRVVKGTAVYTSSFRPPTEPLTNITNTKLLCCNDSSITGSTVTPSTISSGGSPTASTDSPFDDPAAFTFGDSGDQNVIKCGYYIGNGSATGPEINLGWEPQWVMIRNIEGNGKDWNVFDSMRGLTTNSGDDLNLIVNSNKPEDYDNSAIDALDLTPTGFKIVTSDSEYNANNSRILYMAIRRPDGYVGKPPELGTDVFAMDTGNSSSNGPAFDSGFPVDMGLRRKPASGNSGTPDTDWATYNRLLGITYLRANTTDVETSSSKAKWDLMTGFNKEDDSTYQAWMWKRHAGFDVVTYIGKADSAGAVEIQHVPHSLGNTPEMMWVKRRDSGSGTANWFVYHKGLNGGSSPQNYHMYLNSSGSEGVDNGVWKNTAPTATHFTVGGAYAVNQEDKNFIALLFASVDGISKVGYYTGNASGNVALNCGFVPRFFMTKAIDANTGWLTVDSKRDVNMGKRLFLDSTAAETSYDAVFAGQDYIESNKTGLSVNGVNYVFYAHK